MTRSFFLVAILGAFALSGLGLAAQAPGPGEPPYRNARLPVEQRVGDLLGRMTAAEKARMLAGSGWMESSPTSALASRHQDGGRPPGCPQLGRLLRGHERGGDGSGQRHGVSRRHRHGVELGPRPRAGARAAPSRSR